MGIGTRATRIACRFLLIIASFCSAVPAQGTAVFDGVTLTLDRVDAQEFGQFFLQLQLQGDTLNVSAITELASASVSPDARFTVATNQLSISSLQFGAESFHVLLQHVPDTGLFELLSFVPNPADSLGRNTANTSSPLAVNIAPFQAWTPGWVLIDLFPKAQPWVSNLCNSDIWNSGPPLTLDAQGWVTELPENVCADSSVLSSQPGHYPAGTYVLLWEGEGEIIARWDVAPEVSSSSSPVTESGGLSRMTFDVLAENQSELGIGIRLSALGGEPLRNARLIPPGGMCGHSPSELDYFSYCATPRGGDGFCPVEQSCFDFEDIYWDRFRDDPATMNEPKPVFHPRYADTYRGYRAIRFMKWLRPEDSLDREWSERIQLTHQPFTRDDKGLPVEYALAFTNLLNAHPWLNIPMPASDDYNRAFAELVNNRLAPHLNFFLEYGNENFNSDQPVPFFHALDSANADPEIPATDDDLIKVAKFTARRSAEIFNIWRESLTSPERMIAVLGGFNPVAGYTEAVLDHNNAFQEADALAINGYIGPHRGFVEDQSAFDAMTLEDLLAEIDHGSVLGSGASLPELNAQYQQHAAMAAARGLTLVAYEGNNFMATTGGPPGIVEVFFAANRDRRLGDRFIINLENFRAAGGRDFFHFLNEDIWTDQGAFGARQFQDLTREEAPVFDALMDFIESSSCWWTDCLIPPP